MYDIYVTVNSRPYLIMIKHFIILYISIKEIKKYNKINNFLQIDDLRNQCRINEKHIQVATDEVQQKIREVAALQENNGKSSCYILLMKIISKDNGINI